MTRLARGGSGETAPVDSGVEMGAGEFPAGYGVLLYGPPGCGKRSLGRWFAAECRSRLVSVDCLSQQEELAAALDDAR